jgi:hypothetical protein
MSSAKDKRQSLMNNGNCVFYKQRPTNVKQQQGRSRKAAKGVLAKEFHLQPNCSVNEASIALLVLAGKIPPLTKELFVVGNNRNERDSYIQALVDLSQELKANAADIIHRSLTSKAKNKVQLEGEIIRVLAQKHKLNELQELARLGLAAQSKMYVKVSLDAL